MAKPRSQVAMYIYLAVGCGALGVAITFGVLYAVSYFGIDITENWWLVAIPVILSIIVNVLLIELFHALRRR